MDNNDIKKRQTTNYLRIAVSVVVGYYGYSILTDINNSDESKQTFLIIASIIFIVLATLLVISSVHELMVLRRQEKENQVNGDLEASDDSKESDDLEESN